MVDYFANADGRSNALCLHFPHHFQRRAYWEQVLGLGEFLPGWNILFILMGVIPWI